MQPYKHQGWKFKQKLDYFKENDHIMESVKRERGLFGESRYEIN